MLRNPRKTLQCNCNNVTVSLPLTEIDIDEIVTNVIEVLQNGGSELLCNILSLDDLKDVNLRSHVVEDGSVLIYDQAEGQWIPTKSLIKQTVDGGQY